MRRQVFSILLLGAIGVLVVGLLYGIYCRFRDLRMVNDALRGQIALLSSGNPADMRVRQAELRTEGLCLDPSLEGVNENGDTVRFVDVLKGGGIVFCYSGSQCGACVDQQMRLAKDFFRGARSSQCFVVSDFPIQRDMQVFKDLHKIDAHILKRLSAWMLPADSLNEPYYLVLDSTVCIERVFIPRKEHSEVSEAFFGAMARRWGK